MNRTTLTSFLAAGGILLAGCDRSDRAATYGGDREIVIDGSSTVAPISTVAAELFAESHQGIQVSVGTSGTGGGFKKFLDADPRLRTDINNASRPIKPAEIERAREIGIEFIELPIALDGIAVVVNPRNDFCDHLTIAELRRIWAPDSRVTNWKDVRDGFPDLPLRLYGPGTDSGTFDYFTEAINGREKVSRSDYQKSEDDNVLVHGVSGDRGALGYFGFAYYEENRDKLKLLGVDAGEGPVRPSTATVRDGSYRPLSRPLFLYVNAEALNRPEITDFLTFYLDHARHIVEHPRVMYVALPDELYTAARTRIQKRITGTVFTQPASGPADLASLYRER